MFKLSAKTVAYVNCIVFFRQSINCQRSVSTSGLRPSVLGQDWSETQKSVLVLVLQVWCCFVKHDLVTLVVIMILKDTATFHVLFIVSLFCAWNITTVEINSGVHLLKS